jgi:hypothetical protein
MDFNNVNLENYFLENDGNPVFAQSDQTLFSLFQSAMDAQNQNSVENREFLHQFLKKIKFLIPKITNELKYINTVISIYGHIYSLDNEDEFSDKLIRHSLKILNIQNVFNYLKNAIELKNEGLVIICVKFIESMIGAKIHLSPYDISIDTSSLLINFDELAQYITKLNDVIEGDLQIKLTTKLISIEVEEFLKIHGEKIRILSFKDINDLFLDKIFGYTPKLKHLEINGSVLSEQDLQSIAASKTINRLFIYKCHNFENLQFFPENLEELELRGCEKLKKIGQFPNSLLCVTLFSCPEITEIPTLNYLLQTIDIGGCPKLCQESLIEHLSIFFDQNPDVALEQWFNFSIDLATLAELFIKKIGVENLCCNLSSYYKKVIPDEIGDETEEKEFLSQLISDIIENHLDLFIHYYPNILESLNTFENDLKVKLENDIKIFFRNTLNKTNVLKILKFAISIKSQEIIDMSLLLLEQKGMKFLPNIDKSELLLYITMEITDQVTMKNLIDDCILTFHSKFKIAFKAKNLKYLNDNLENYKERVSIIIIENYDSSYFQYFSSFPNCIKLHISEKERDISTVSKLDKLEYLIIENHKNSEFNFKWPQNLKQLALLNCPNILKLPSLTTSTTQLIIKNCVKLSDDSKLKALSQISDKDKTLWFNSCLNSKIQNTKALTELFFKKLDLNEILYQLTYLFDNNISIELILEVSNKLLNEHFNYFLNHLPSVLKNTKFSKFSERFNSEKWNAAKSLKPDKIKLTTQLETVKDFEDIKEKDIAELFVLFDKINFTNPDGKDYIDPTTVRYRGTFVKSDDLRAGFSKIIEHIKNNLAYNAVPNDEKERFKWYRQLEYALKLFIQLSNNSSETYTISKRLISLAASAATEFCGTVWRNEAIEAIEALENKNFEEKPQGLVNQLIQWCDERKMFTMEKITEGILYHNLNTISNQVHIYNGVAKKMIELGFKLPNLNSVQLNDPWTPIWSNYPSFNVEEHIKSYFNFFDVSGFILHKINNELYKKINDKLILNLNFINLLLENFYVYAESKLQIEMEAIENSLKEKQKELGLKKVKNLIEEKHMDIAILHNSEEAEVTFKNSNKSLLFRQRKQMVALRLKRKASQLLESDRPLKKLKVSEEILMDEENLKTEEIGRIKEEMAKYQSYIENPDTHLNDIEMLVDIEVVTDAIQDEKIAKLQQYLTDNHLLTFNDDGSIKVYLAGVLELLKHLKFLS